MHYISFKFSGCLIKAVFLVVCLHFCAGPYFADAQILNISNERVEKDTSDAWLGDLSFMLSLRQQGIKVAEFNWRNDIVYLSHNNAYMAISDINVVKLDKNQLISDAYLHGRVTFQRRRIVCEEAFIQYQYDISRGLEDRVLLGGGLRIKFRHGEKLDVVFGPGVMYEKEEWRYPIDVPGADVKAFNSFKSTTYLSVQEKFNENVNLNGVLYYQARFNDFKEPRISGEVNLNIKLSRYLAFISRYKWLYDSEPVVPVTKLVYTFTNGITVNF
ncbi:MAG: DUF481 domain-containing protein [Bacteroidota bacterium]